METYSELVLRLLLVVGVVVNTLSTGHASGLRIRLGVWGWRLAALVGGRHCDSVGLGFCLGEVLLRWIGLLRRG